MLETDTNLPDEKSFDDVFEETFCKVIETIVVCILTIIVCFGSVSIVVLALLPLYYLATDIKCDMICNIGIATDISISSIFGLSVIYYLFLQMKKLKIKETETIKAAPLI